MRRLIVAALAIGGCAAGVVDPLEGPGDAVAGARAFAESATVRRAAVEASVAVADTDYGRLRLAHYSLSGAGIDDPSEDWDSAPVFEWVVRDVVPGAAPGPVAEIGSLETLADYVALGREVYERLPVQVDPRFARLRDPDTARDYGLAVEPDGRVRGIVEVESAGVFRVGITCGACHDSPRADGTLIAGASNATLRFGDLLGAPGERPGTMDVTPDGIDNPVRPSDLRTIQLQSRLHHAGNLANGRLARMVRIDTLIAGRFDYDARIDRRMIAAISLYLDSLADELPRPVGDRTAFAASCAGCHAGEAMAGGLVEVAVVGTDPLATVGSSRATGGYRTPSLLGVADRGALLHDGSAAGLPELLGLMPSDHIGHRFGLELEQDQRRAIIAYLSP